MRWKLSLAVPAFLLLVLATDGLAQVPVTVTLPPEPSPVDAVTFPNIPPGTTFQAEPNGGERIQHFVGQVNASGGRYTIIADVHVGGSVHTNTFSFAAQDSCQNTVANEGVLERIACSVVEAGNSLVCSAIYDNMHNPPYPTCEGTVACMKCPGGMKICGSSPQCY